MPERSTVVLVHGAWHGAWCWDEVVSRLGGDGLGLVAVDLPSVVSGGDLYDDARAVREVLDDTPGDKVVVGHSYGGIVITEGAAGAEGVRHLVYLTAFMLDEGESLADVAGRAARWQIPDARRQDDDASRARRRSSTTRARPRSPTRPPRACARTPSPHSWSRSARSPGATCPPPTSSATATRPSRCPRRRRWPRTPAPRTASTTDHSPFLTDPDAVADLIRAVRISVQNAEERGAAADHRVVTSVCNGSMPSPVPRRPARGEARHSRAAAPRRRGGAARQRAPSPIALQHLPGASVGLYDRELRCLLLEGPHLRARRHRRRRDGRQAPVGDRLPRAAGRHRADRQRLARGPGRQRRDPVLAHRAHDRHPERPGAHADGTIEGSSSSRATSPSSASPSAPAARPSGASRSPSTAPRSAWR